MTAKTGVYHCTDCKLNFYETEDKRCPACGGGRTIVLAPAPEPDFRYPHEENSNDR